MAAPNFNNSEPHSMSTPVSTKTRLTSPEIKSGQVNETESTPQQTAAKYSESTPQQYSTERSSNQPKLKLPPLNPRQCYWNGDRTQLRPYIKQWYNHIVILSEGAQDEEALMFLQQCTPPAYKYVIQKSKYLKACFQHLEALCINERINAERTEAQGNPRSSNEDGAMSRHQFSNKRK